MELPKPSDTPDSSRSALRTAWIPDIKSSLLIACIFVTKQLTYWSGETKTLHTTPWLGISVLLYGHFSHPHLSNLFGCE